MSRDISHYLANLNSLDPIDFAGSSSGGRSEDGTSSNAGPVGEDDLAIFSNTQFFDFDVGRSTNIAVTVDDLLMQQERQLQGKKPPPPNEYSYSASGSGSNTASTSSGGGASGSGTGPYDFGPLREFSIANELPQYNPHHHHHAPHMPPHPHHHEHHHNNAASSSSASPSISGGMSTFGASGVGSYGMNASTSSAQQALSADINGDNGISYETISSPATSIGSGSTDRKRKASSQQNLPDNSDKACADEDKRRRNTAASARFRIKKKLREQEMERSTRELQDKVQSLETKVMQLEMENRWLKNLVVEKNEARDLTDLEAMRNRIMGVMSSSKKEEPLKKEN